MRDINSVKAAFARTLGESDHPSFVYFAPGRINIIGEHTDYNGGFVFPGAVDTGIMAVIRPNGTDRIHAYAIDLDEEATFGLGEEEGPEAQWARYIFGVSREMQKKGVAMQGFDTAFSGDVPLGAGMSSSAALESCYARAFNELFGEEKVETFDLAIAGQMTEHHYIGVNCGIMDQFASVFGREGHIMRLDCRSLEYEYFPWEPEGYRLVLIDTVVKHNLASGAYNDRRASCERVVKSLQEAYPDRKIEYLRDADLAMLDSVRDKVSVEDALRAEYVIEEIERVLEVSEALERGDYSAVGRKMYQTHWGLSMKYEVSCEELDFLVLEALHSGVTGSRVMGGGFGGCTINLVREELYDDFIAHATKAYEEKFDHAPKVYPVIIGDGARRLE